MVDFAKGLIICLLVAGALQAAPTDQRLIIPVPEKSGIPKDKITLSIRIPPKIEVEDEVPKARKRPRSAAWDRYDFRPFKKIPRKRFILDTLKRFVRKGVVTDMVSRHFIHDGIADQIIIMTTLSRVYKKLLDVHAHSALKRMGVTIDDLERFQQVVELLKKPLPSYRMNQIQMNKNIEDMIAFLRKTSGKGQLRIVEVKEKKDGSTILELEILKGE